ncbi:dTDP-4-dehydrorhamnose reductase [Pseudaminobacter soli (ex Zhang et al. 2022)]|nr:dTDP-4-dehydrorhamnose reductase [Pseudaminobacter soli]
MFGRTGQVARELALRAPDGVIVQTLGRAEADLRDPARCAGAILESDADIVLNAAAYTAVDRAEEEEEVARAVNAVAPAAMAKAAATRGLPFIHLSSDYVFDGSGNTAWAPDAATRPINAYGRTKRAGEEAVIACGGRTAILRTSWVFSAHGNNFVKTMLRLGGERDRIKVVGDQIGGPTSTADIVDALLVMAHVLLRGGECSGVYHFSGAPDVSWAGFAREIFRQAALPVEVDEIPTASYPTPARRPLNSRLDCGAFTKVFGIRRPDWRVSLSPVLRALRAEALVVRNSGQGPICLQ